MNRVVLSVISQKNSLRRQDVQVLSQLCNARPLQQVWRSQKFGIYPLQITLYLSNPPFNKISFSIPKQHRTRIQLLVSRSGKQYSKIEEVNQQVDDFDDYPQGGIVSKFFKQSKHYSYLKLKFHQPKEKKGYQNLCRQIGIRAIEVSNIIYFNCKYLCSMRRRLQMHPALFRILELLQYKVMVLQKQLPSRIRGQIKEKHIRRMGQIQSLIYKKGINQIHPQRDIIDKLNVQFQQLLDQPILEEQELDFSNPVQIKGKIRELQKQLGEFYVDRLNNLQPNVTSYFQKYWNQEIRDIYLRLLSSPEEQDQTKGLVQFWCQIKSLNQLPANTQQATLMFLNYYLEFIQVKPIKTAALKTLCLFLKIQSTGFKLYHIYQRILFNLLNCLLIDKNEELYQSSQKTIFQLYRKMPNSAFLNQFLDRQTHSKTEMKLKKLEMLQKIILNDQSFQTNNQGKQLISEFILDILFVKQLTVQQKNKAYNIVAFLASTYGKSQIMANFQKLNSMILMNMQKIIDKKLSHLEISQKEQKSSNDLRQMCDYCGQQNPQFGDDNIYDVHCFKQCKMLTVCQHCSCIVQICELPKHYLQECSVKNKFKNCQNCNDVVFIDKQQDHRKKCARNFVTKCPLCEQKLQSKLKIKEHLLKDGCPNNTRC